MNTKIKKSIVGALVVAALTTGGVTYARNASLNVNLGNHISGNNLSTSIQVNLRHEGVVGIRARARNASTTQSSGWNTLAPGRTLSGGDTIRSGTVTVLTRETGWGDGEFRLLDTGNTWHLAPSRSWAR